MTALSANAVRPGRNLKPVVRKYSAGVDIFYTGALVMINAAGYAMPAAAEDQNHGCVGVCAAYVDNSGGSAGDLYVEVLEGEFLFAADTVTQAAVGTILYADDDNTVDTTSTNAPTAGFVTEFVSATSVWVDVSPMYASQDAP